MSRIFGQIAQIGYVVADIEASMLQWIRHGVGPWFYIERVQTDYFRHRGVDSPVQMSIALANSGDVQIELIQQRNDAPSMYREFLDSGRSGAQHVAYWTTDFAYLDTEHDQGTVIEISDISGAKGQLFAYIREQAAAWDGTDPIRRIG
jgi:Glyoxalase/Bleomycin resistance protein/Dioxygenase superfamily